MQNNLDLKLFLSGYVNDARRKCLKRLMHSQHYFQIGFIDSKKNGGKLLVINGFRFFRNKKRGSRQYWKCSNYYKEKCPAIAIYDEITMNIRLCHQHKHVTSNDIEIKPFLSKDCPLLDDSPIDSLQDDIVVLKV